MEEATWCLVNESPVYGAMKIPKNNVCISIDKISNVWSTKRMGRRCVKLLGDVLKKMDKKHLIWPSQVAILIII